MTSLKLLDEAFHINGNDFLRCLPLGCLLLCGIGTIAVHVLSPLGDVLSKATPALENRASIAMKNNMLGGCSDEGEAPSLQSGLCLAAICCSEILRLLGSIFDDGGTPGGGSKFCICVLDNSVMLTEAANGATHNKIRRD